jgi:hypothetical protein
MFEMHHQLYNTSKEVQYIVGIYNSFACLGAHILLKHVQAFLIHICMILCFYWCLSKYLNMFLVVVTGTQQPHLLVHIYLLCMTALCLSW